MKPQDQLELDLRLRQKPEESIGAPKESVDAPSEPEESIGAPSEFKDWTPEMFAAEIKRLETLIRLHTISSDIDSAKEIRGSLQVVREAYAKQRQGK
jgi:hypothetical protein